MFGLDENRCVFCSMPISQGEASVQCTSCQKRYHAACWMLNTRCVTPDCPGKMTELTSAAVRIDPVSGSIPSDRSPQGGEKTRQGAADGGSVSIPPLQNDGVGAAKKAPSKREMPIDEELLNQFFGENPAYYRNAFRKMKKQNPPIVWNWVAFFIPGFWMIYRKMYVYGAALLGLNLLLMHLLPKVYPVFILVQALAAGLFGNLLYKFDIEQRVKKAQTLSGDAQRTYLANHTGIDKVVAYVAAGAFGALAIILSILIG